MTADQRNSVELHFAALMDQTPERREEGLRAIADEAVRREVASLLEHAGMGETVADIIGSVAAEVGDRDSPERSGRRVGPYRLVRRLGQGGQGTVFEAVRDDGSFHQRVAIKIVRWEMDDPVVRTRFRSERQILAGLEHPNIARLLDGGETEDGAPYLVMEFVEGLSLTQAAKEWPLERKLEAFLEVCRAVAFAHRNLIVHRDLKPANILVTADGTPKLLDFGIAKLVDSDHERTATMVHALTPEYASPEQVRGEHIGTACDIYSLGVVLYELLAGRRPYEVPTRSPMEIHKAVCLTEPPPPGVSADLDNIIAMAMRKEPERRYPTVEQFAQDIERSMKHRPVLARKGTFRYRAGKFVRRNALALATGCALAASLIGGAAFAAVEARRAERRFAQVRDLANTVLFQFYDQVSPLPGSTAVRASIVETARKYLDGLAGEAGNDQGLLLELAQAYARLGEVQGSATSPSLGRVEEARRSFRASMDLYDRVPVKPDSPLPWRLGAARGLEFWAEMEYAAKRPDDAEALGRRAMQLTEAGNGEDQSVTLMHSRAAWNLAQAMLAKGFPTEALAVLDPAIRSLRELQARQGANPVIAGELEVGLQNAARARVREGDLDGAAAAFQELLQTAPACDLAAPKPRECRLRWTRLSWVADVYAAVDRPNLGQPEKAAPLYERAIEVLESICRADPEDGRSHFDLAGRYGKLGDAVWRSDPKRALDLYAKAMTTAEALVSKEQIGNLRGSYLGSISRPLVLLGRTAEARRAMTELRELEGPAKSYEDRLGDLDNQATWGRLLVAEGNRLEAERTLLEAIRNAEVLRQERPKDLAAIFFLSILCRELAGITSPEGRREALQRSAAAWHSWPPTSFTVREEQRDLAAVKQ